MRTLAAVIAGTAMAIAVLLSGCGGSGGDTSASSASPVDSTDVHTSVAGSEAVGVAADAGLNQLYSGGAIALREPLPSTSLSDAPSTVSEILHTASNAPPMPVTGSTTITTSSYTDPIFTSGQVMFEADATGLPSDWFHVSLTFVAGQPFVITDENGDIATISSGTFNLYVHDQVLTNDNLGNWTRQVDCYASISATTPITATITFSGGGARTTAISGIRHCSRAITHTSTGSGPASISRTDNVQIDGNTSGLSGIITPAPADGPARTDRNGASHPFTQWIHTTVGTNGTHTLVWNRFCTYTVVYTYPQGTTVWVGTIPAYFENIYVQKDGGALIGPLSDLQLNARFGLLIDLNTGTQFF